MAPISCLISKGRNRFEWTVETDDAFNKVRELLVSEPVLSCPDYTKPFKIQCDASDVGIGGILVQGEGESERVVAYMREKLTSAERKYYTTEKECLAVIRSIDKFRPYVEGVKFVVITDHASLLWLLKLKDLSGRVGRWALRLQAHDFELKHRKGKFMVVPDALFRVYSIKSIGNDPWYEGLREKVCQAPNRYPQFTVKENAIYKYCVNANLANNPPVGKS